MTKRTRLVTALARSGYAARGLVYVVIGLMAILAALGSAQKEDDREAVKTLLHQPFGELLLWTLVGGLIGYVAWRLVQSIFDTDDHGWGLKGVAVRGALLVSAFSYGTLAVFALSALGVFSGGSGGGGDGTPIADAITGFVGQRVVAAVLTGVFFGVAIAHFYKAYRSIAGELDSRFKASGHAMKTIRGVSLVGLTARGLVFVVIGVLLFKRFLNAQSATADRPGMSDALSYVQGLPAGTVLLVALGAGLIVFAAYSITEAVWRRIDLSEA